MSSYINNGKGVYLIDQNVNQELINERREWRRQWEMRGICFLDDVCSLVSIYLRK